MTYAVINQFVYSNALAGAVAGMGINQGNPTNPNPSFYFGMCQVAETFAQSFDTRWAAISLFPADEFNIQAILATCKSYWTNRNASVAVGTPGEFTTQTNFDSISNALIAMINEAESLYPPPGPPPISTGGNDLVLSPSNPAGNHANVYTTWPALMTARNALNGPIRIQLDPTFAACHVTATGTPWNLDECTFTSSIDGTILNFDNGAEVTYGLLELDNVVFINNGASAPANIPINSMLILRGNSTIESSTTSPWGLSSVGEAQAFLIVNEGSTIGDGTHPVFDGPTTLQTLIIGGSIVQPNAFANTASAVITKGADSTLAFPQPSAITFQQSNNETVVFRPGGVAGPNVYTSWAGASQAVHAYQGARTLLIDDTNAAAHMTAGGPYDLNNTTIQGFSNPSVISTLHIDEGALISPSTTQLYLLDVILSNEATATVPWTPSQTALIGLLNDFTTLESTHIAFLHVTAAGSFTNIYAVGSDIGDNTHPVITVDAGQTVVCQLMDFSSLRANALAGAGTAAVQIAPVATYSTTQGITTQTLTGSTLNQISSTTVTGSGTNTATVGPTAAMTQKHTGNVQVSVFASVTGTNAGVLTAGLSGSVSGLIAAVNQSIAAGAQAAIQLVAPDTVNIAGQTWSLVIGSVGNAVGNLTVLATPKITVTEYN